MFIFTLEIIVISWDLAFNLDIIIPKALFYYSEASKYIKKWYLYHIFSHHKNDGNALERQNPVAALGAGRGMQPSPGKGPWEYQSQIWRPLWKANQP